MKTRYFYFLASTVLLLAACAKEIEEVVLSDERTATYLTVSLATDTKTHMDADKDAGNNHTVYWSNGDQIAVNGKESVALADVPDNCQSTVFSFNDVINTPYKIIYPASVYSDATHVTLPAVQSYRAGGFAEGMFPMAGYSTDGGSINLAHLCAMVKISVKRETAEAAEARSGEVDTDNIACVRFKGRDGEQVSGSFEINYSTHSLAAADGTGTGLEVRVSKNLATSTSTATEYYLVVPAREYSNGFDVIVQDANGHIMTKSKTTSKTF